MGFGELCLIAVGLSMDAFAVSICKGLSMDRFRLQNAVVIALFFGVFQALMPLLGWLLGSQLEQYITAFDHWIAFGLLAFLGGKMIREAFAGDSDDAACDARIDLRELVLLSIATSIDALVVGITFSLLHVSILPSITLIGGVTFVICLAGVWIGHTFGSRLMKKAQIAGGCVLILIGLKILLEHLGIL